MLNCLNEWHLFALVVLHVSLQFAVLTDALVKGESLVMDESHLPMFNEDGFLAVYKRGQWQIQCSSSSNLLGLAFTACSSLGFQ